MRNKIIFASVLVIMIFVYAFAINDDLSDSMVRFHVVANSNSDFDQELKIKVRDAVLSETGKLTAGITDKEEAVKTVMTHKDKIVKEAERVIIENGCSYDVNLEYGNFYFPEKSYDNIELPSGRYDAIRINIGKAEGKNWWCVMFPPLCITEDATDELDERAMKYLKENLSEEEFELVKKGKSAPVVIRFRIVDAVMKLVEKMA